MEKYFSNNNPAIVSSDRILYTASNFARTSLLHLQEIGSLRALRPHTSSRSNLQSYLFFIVTCGSGYLVFDQKRYELKAGSSIFINCQKAYAHTPNESDLWSLQWCHFYGPTMSLIYNKYCERGGRPVFTPEDITPIIKTLNSLMLVARSSDYMRDMRINEGLSTLVRLVMSESWHPEDRILTNKRANVADVKKYLDEHYREKISLENLSTMFYIDKYYLSKTFHFQFGVNISSYLQNVRITHAKRLLRFSTKTVEEIGYEVGIGNPAYFSRVFKSVEGVSPKMYRDKW